MTVSQKLDSNTSHPQTSYLSLVPLPEEAPIAQDTEPSPEAELIPAEAPSISIIEHEEDLASELLPPSQPPERARLSSQPPSSSLLSASAQTHEELSGELARMAEQLKRNTVYFSESLDKDKGILQSAGEVLEKNYNSLTKEQGRLKVRGGAGFWNTWMTLAAIIGVCLAWVMMFIIIRVT